MLKFQYNFDFKYETIYKIVQTKFCVSFLFNMCYNGKVIKEKR